MSKFFTYEDRLNLQKKLKESMSIKAIATDLGKNPTTISREIKKYSSEIATGYPGYPFNECKNRFNCRNKNICGKDCSRNQSFEYKINKHNLFWPVPNSAITAISAHLLPMRFNILQ